MDRANLNKELLAGKNIHGIFFIVLPKRNSPEAETHSAPVIAANEQDAHVDHTAAGSQNKKWLTDSYASHQQVSPAAC